jgi:hypothetical protein
VPIVFKSGSLNLLEPSGSFQACNETALPFYCTGYYQRRERAVIKTISDFIQRQNSNNHLVKSTKLLNVKEIEKFEDLGLDVWIILKWMFREIREATHCIYENKLRWFRC